MEIRPINYQTDLDQIEVLLKENFTTNKTIEQFKWKHLENPFGNSFGLVATDFGKIIGLRMFMRWEFVKHKQLIKAIRPVDTCTDNAYRGKGIFLKLTQEALRGAKKDFDLIFNTPNKMSRRGYFKMGWKKVPREVRYQMGLVNPFLKSLNFSLINPDEVKNLSINPEVNLETNVSSEFVSWRYKEDKYKQALFKDGTLVVYKKDKIKGLGVIVLLDIFNRKKKSSTYLNSIAKFHNALLVYFLKCEKLSEVNFPLKISRASQLVVIKEDNLNLSRNLNFSAGDLDRLL